MEVKLKARHIIMVSKLVSKLNIKIDFTEKDNTKLGAQVILDLITNIQFAEKELYDLLGDIVGYTQEKIADTDIEELIDVLQVVVRKIINFIRPPAESIT